jgi:regulator of protease activity HflC (stomatin/prohibitin superfamily)
MKKILGLLVIAAALATTACSKVPAGNVGVKVYLLGGAKGVDQEVLTTGRYWIGFNEELFLFPTYSQNYVWTKDAIEASPTDESISFGTREGLSVSADVGITYAIHPDKVALVFQKYRKGVEEITDVYLRNMVRDALVKAASTRDIETVYGAGKTELIAEVEQIVRSQVQDVGIIVERIYWVGDLRLPPAITNSINAKIQATQISMQRENEIKTAQAQALIEIAKAKGEADAQLERARAESESIKMRGDAEVSAIRSKANALAQNANLVELIRSERWDGKLPTSTVPGSAVPFMNLK